MEQNRVNATIILDTLKGMVESKKLIPKEEWITVAGKLTLLRIDEAKMMNKMRQEVSRIKLKVIEGQEKKNVSLAEAEVHASDAYRMLRDQEDLLYSLDEFVRIAKRASDTEW